MTTEAKTTRMSIAKIVAKGSCPLCFTLMQDQFTLVETLKTRPGMRFCSYHAWSIANKAPAEEAVAVLLEGLRDRAWKLAAFGSPDCAVCRSFARDKEARLWEMRQELEDPKMQDWLRREGTICVHHARELEERLPAPLAELVQEIVARNSRELEEQLQRFEQEVAKGIRRGIGILGRVTEFIVSRRGIAT